jgi:hypothetical protein
MYIKSFLEYMEDNKQGGALVLFDQEKAFDRNETKFIFNVLKENGFGLKYIKWIKTLYKNISSKIQINRKLSDHIYLKRCETGMPYLNATLCYWDRGTKHSN